MISLKGIPGIIWEMLREAVNLVVSTARMIAKMIVLILVIAIAMITGSIGTEYVKHVMGWQPKLVVTNVKIITGVNIMDVNAPVIVIPPPESRASIPDFGKSGPARKV
jgi:hypothetical protein